MFSGISIDVIADCFETVGEDSTYVLEVARVASLFEIYAATDVEECRLEAVQYR